MIRLLALTLLLGQAVLAQGLVSFPSTSENIRYPYNLWLRNESETLQTVRLGDVHARLYPVAPDLGKKAEARLVFAPDTPTLVKLPSRGKDVILPFRLETDAPRGVYALETDLPQGSDNPPGYTPVADYPVAYTPNLHVPTAPSVGDRFLYLSGFYPENFWRSYRRASRPLRHRQVYGRVFTLLSQAKKRTTFDVKGLGKVTLHSASRNFPGLAPILDDPDLATVRRAYVGKRVWRYGGSEPDCRPTDGSTVFRTAQIPLHVRRVMRVAWPSGLNLAGGYGYGGYAASFQGDMMTGTPLVIQSELAKFGARLRPCQNTELFTDTWQLERTFSLTPPPPGPRPRPGLIGLTRSQYAWLKGFPSSNFGTKAHLFTLDTWEYDFIPFPITVTFKNGRAVKRDVPRLP